jgi:hypothetical protein
VARRSEPRWAVSVGRPGAAQRGRPATAIDDDDLTDAAFKEP